MALGCHWRIAAEGAGLGLPGCVTLGLIAGAGRTVRLPRLVAPAEAVAIVAEGRPVSAAHARELGLVDAAIAKGELLPAALRFAAEVAGRPLPVPLAKRPPKGGITPPSRPRPRASSAAPAASRRRPRPSRPSATR